MPATLLAQLSDPHVCAPGSLAMGRVDTPALLGAAVAAVLRLRQRPDAVIVTGDLANLATAEEYAHLAELLAPLPMPVYLMMGNHDDRAALRRQFAQHPWLADGEFVQYAVDIGGVLLIVLDTSVPRRPEGALCERRLAWLAATLDRHRGRRTIVAMHHPPFRTFIGHMDGMGLERGRNEFEAIIARHPQVERIICGHLHRAIEARVGGTVAMTCPSTAHQVQLDLADDAVALWTREPPGLLLHVWDTEGPIVSHLVFSGVDDGPYAFDADARRGQGASSLSNP